MRTYSLLFISTIIGGLSWITYKECREPKERDIVFHAGPAESGLGVIYFDLYKDGRYQFCDGHFLDPGCYTGKYQLSGDTITLLALSKHSGLVTNRFLVCRYEQMNNQYWHWKAMGGADYINPNSRQDTIAGATGDIWPLDLSGKPILTASDYWVIRLDKL